MPQDQDHASQPASPQKARPRFLNFYIFLPVPLGIIQGQKRISIQEIPQMSTMSFVCSILIFVFLAIFLPIQAIAQSDDLILLRYDGKTYTCEEIVGIRYEDGMRHVKGVEEKFQGIPIDFKWSIHLQPSTWYTNRQAPESLEQVYHQQLGGAAAWFLMGKILDGIERDFPDVVNQVYDREVLRKTVHLRCRLMQSYAESVSATLLSRDTEPGPKTFSAKLLERGLTPPDSVTLTRHYKIIEEHSALFALTHGCTRYWLEGEPTPWAEALYRLMVMGPLLEELLTSKIDESTRAAEKRFGRFTAIVLDGVTKEAEEPLTALLARLISPDGNIAQNGFASLLRMRQELRVRGDILHVRERLSRLRSSYAIPDDIDISAGNSLFVPSKKYDGFYTFVRLTGEAPEMPQMELTPKLGTLFFGAARDAVMEPMVSAVFSKAYLNDLALFPNLELGREALIHCNALGSFPPSFYGIEMPNPMLR